MGIRSWITTMTMTMTTITTTTMITTTTITTMKPYQFTIIVHATMTRRTVATRKKCQLCYVVSLKSFYHSMEHCLGALYL